MIVKGQIEKVETEYSYKVRIPSLDKKKGAVGATPTNDLRTAWACTLPGYIPCFQEGDTVYISFEDTSSPVILGLVNNAASTKKAKDKTSTVYAGSLHASSSAKLPVDTAIKLENGKYVTDTHIQTLRGNTTQINTKFISLDSNIDDNTKKINKHIDNSKMHIVDGELLGVKKIVLTSDMYGSRTPPSPVKGQLFFLVEEES